jgi:hypothetical protein
MMSIPSSSGGLFSIFIVRPHTMQLSRSMRGAFVVVGIVLAVPHFFTFSPELDQAALASSLIMNLEQARIRLDVQHTLPQR